MNAVGNINKYFKTTLALAICFSLCLTTYFEAKANDYESVRKVCKTIKNCNGGIVFSKNHILVEGIKIPQGAKCKEDASSEDDRLEDYYEQQCDRLEEKLSSTTESCKYASEYSDKCKTAQKMVRDTAQKEQAVEAGSALTQAAFQLQQNISRPKNQTEYIRTAKNSYRLQSALLAAKIAVNTSGKIKLNKARDLANKEYDRLTKAKKDYDGGLRAISKSHVVNSLKDRFKEHSSTSKVREAINKEIEGCSPCPNSRKLQNELEALGQFESLAGQGSTFAEFADSEKLENMGLFSETAGKVEPAKSNLERVAESAQQGSDTSTAKIFGNSLGLIGSLLAVKDLKKHEKAVKHNRGTSRLPPLRRNRPATAASAGPRATFDVSAEDSGELPLGESGFDPHRSITHTPSDDSAQKGKQLFRAQPKGSSDNSLGGGGGGGGDSPYPRGPDNSPREIAYSKITSGSRLNNGFANGSDRSGNTNLEDIVKAIIGEDNKENEQGADFRRGLASSEKDGKNLPSLLNRGIEGDLRSIFERVSTALKRKQSEGSI